MELEWDYNKRTCVIAMSGYINKILRKHPHKIPHKPQHSPNKWTAPKYGSSTQQPTESPKGKPISEKRKKGDY